MHQDTKKFFKMKTAGCLDYLSTSCLSKLNCTYDEHDGPNSAFFRETSCRIADRQILFGSLYLVITIHITII